MEGWVYFYESHPEEDHVVIRTTIYKEPFSEEIVIEFTHVKGGRQYRQQLEKIWNFFVKEGACKKPFRVVENYGIGPCIESHGRRVYLGEENRQSSESGKETLELCPEVDEEENANIFLDERTNSMSQRQIEYMDNEACVNITDSSNDPWEDMTEEEILAGTRLSPTPTESIQQCLIRLVEETNDQGFTYLFVSDLVQAAYEVYTEDKDWEEFKDTCTRFLASLRGRPAQSAELTDDSSDEEDTEYDMMVDLNRQCARVFNAEDFVTVAEVDQGYLRAIGDYGVEGNRQLRMEIALAEDREEREREETHEGSDYYDSSSGETLSEYTYSSSESDDSDDDDYYHVNLYKVEDVDGHSYTQGEFSDYYGSSWREHWDAALDRSILLYLRVLFSEEPEQEECEYDCDSYDSGSDYCNGLNSDEEARLKSIALRIEKEFEDAQEDEVFGGAVAPEEGMYDAVDSEDTFTTEERA